MQKYNNLGSCADPRLNRISCRKSIKSCTMCPRSLDPTYVVSYCIKRVKTSWTYSSTHIKRKLVTFSLSDY